MLRRLGLSALRSQPSLTCTSRLGLALRPTSAVRWFSDDKQQPEDAAPAPAPAPAVGAGAGSTGTKSVQVSYKSGSSSITLALPSQVVAAMGGGKPKPKPRKAAKAEASRLIDSVAATATATPSEVVAWATAESYDFAALRSSRRVPANAVLLDDDVLHVPEWQGGQAFIFSSGCYVTWGLDVETSQRFLRAVIQGRDVAHLVEIGRYSHIGDEAMSCITTDPTHGPTRIHGDIILLADPHDSNARLALSQGLARSARLSVQEHLLSSFSQTVSSIPLSLQSTGRVPLHRTQIIHLIGSLLRLRQTANLDRDNFYDEPDLFWDNAPMEHLYRSICSQLDIGLRFETLNEKLDHCENLLAILRALLTESTTHRMELIIIALIALEATVALLSHGWIPQPLVDSVQATWDLISAQLGAASAPAPAPAPAPASHS